MQIIIFPISLFPGCPVLLIQIGAYPPPSPPRMVNMQFRDADQAICSISISDLEFLYLFQLFLISAIYAGLLLTLFYNENFPLSAALHVSVSCSNLERN